jgi:nitrate/nitrite transporter NarK
MHVLITITIVTVLVAFAFGENVARGFVQGLFVLALLAVGLLLWDFYREIPEKKSDRYRLLELEYMPKQRQASPMLGWTFK